MEGECYFCGRRDGEDDVLLRLIPGEVDLICDECEDQHVPCRYCRRAPCGCDDIYDSWKDSQWD
jgi:hypothetical protein